MKREQAVDVEETTHEHMFFPRYVADARQDIDGVASAYLIFYCDCGEFDWISMSDAS